LGVATGYDVIRRGKEIFEVYRGNVEDVLSKDDDFY